MDTTDEQFNLRVSQWVGQTSSKLKRSIAALSMKGKGELVRSLVGRTKKDYGEIESIVYKFNRYGVFFHKGVGRGYIMSGGRVVRGYKFSSRLIMKRQGQPAKIQTGGEIRREPKEWFNPVLDLEVPRLANLVAEMKADMAVNAVAIKIK